MKEKREYNNIFNQGIKAAANSLEHYKQIEREDSGGQKTPLNSTQITFNLMLVEFQTHIESLSK